jgi:protein CpxP
MLNKLFTLALAGAMTLSVSGVALAQDTAGPAQEPGQPGRGPMRMDPNRQLEHMTKELGLSADQQAQIKPVLVDRQQKMEALFQDQSVSREDRHAKMMSIRQDSTARIQAVLNDQQKQKFAAMQEHMRGRGGPGGAEGGAPPQ